jgi:hypothetical protein
MDISLILTKNYPNTEWILNGDKYEGLTWLSDTPKPSKKELEDQWADVQYNSQVNAVKQARHNDYVSPGGSDAVFLKYQRGEATKQEWLDAVQAINDANPYPVKEGK